MNVIDWASYDVYKDFENDSEDEEDGNSAGNDNYSKKQKQRLYKIMMYGVTAEGHSMAIHVENFQPYFYISIPENWTERDLKILEITIKADPKITYFGKKGHISTTLVMKKEFYGFTNEREFKFAMFIFKNYSAFNEFKAFFVGEKDIGEDRKINIPRPIKFGRGKNELVFPLYESNIAPMLRFIHTQDIIPASWITIPAGKYRRSKTTRCQIEATVDWRDVAPLVKNEVAPLLIASVDIECSSEDGSFPMPERKADPIIQIGTTVNRYGEKDCFLYHIVTLKQSANISIDDIIEGIKATNPKAREAKEVVVECYKDEKSVVMAWAKFIERLDPDVLTGYNIWGFDMKYIYTRAKTGNGVGKGKDIYDYSDQLLEKLSRNRERKARYVEKELSSSALGDNVLKFFDIEGVVSIDLMKVVQRDYKLESYKLDAVAEHFLGLNKIDLPPKKIFEYFKAGTPDKIKEIAVYCLRDCELVNLLIHKLVVISNNIGMANVCFIPLSYLFLRGQGVKVFSLVSKHSRQDGYLIKVVEPDPNDKGTYEGAIVFPPTPGIYLEPIAVNDYNSLYPSSMIAENISHDSIVWIKTFDLAGNLTRFHDGQGKQIHVKGKSTLDNLPDYNYNDISYDLFEGQQKDKRKVGLVTCRYAEKKTGEKGIVPRILMSILKARKDTRAEISYGTIATIPREGGEEESHSGVLTFIEEDNAWLVAMGAAGKKKIPKGEVAKIIYKHDDFTKQVLDGYQLALKISANSVYGQLGAATSQICYKALAASTTAVGRGMLSMARDKISEKFPGAKLIYGDTDSTFFNFMGYITPRHGADLSDYDKLRYTAMYCQEAADYVSSLCKKPHCLAFEKILFPFIIFSKKRYCGHKYENSIKKYKQASMGIVLKRRDNAPIVKEIYGGIINIILKEKDIEKAKTYFAAQVANLLEGKVPIDQLIITKSIRGTYVNPTTIAHKVLAERMGERDPGNKPLSNDRIPYCFIDPAKLLCEVPGCGARKMNIDNCKCVTCMKLFCATHLHNHRATCRRICRFCHTDVKTAQCRICKGWFCPADLARHMRRIDKEGVERTDKCKKALTNKMLQGDMIESPQYIKERNLAIDSKYYLEHQIEKPVIQIFALTMKNPYSLIEEIVRKYDNSKAGNSEITMWFKSVPVQTTKGVSKLEKQIDESGEEGIFENLINDDEVYELGEVESSF